MGKQVDKKTITWVIKKFSFLPSASIHSDQFVVGGCKWCLRAYPKANNLALYLTVPNSESFPIGWRRHAKFSLTLVNQKSENLSILRAESQHWFDQNSTSWGFPDMIPLSELHAKEEFLMNGELIVVAKIEVLEVVGKLDVSQESSSVVETVDVNGFQVLPSLNPYMKTAYMNVLLSLTKTLCQSPQDLSNEDMSGAGAALTYLREAGFKLDWLEKKLGEVKEKKKKEDASLKRLQEMEEQLTPLKRKYLDLEAQIDKEKAELLAARAPLSSNEDNVV
ncbi:MATH/TRAF domain [Arabidopsis thaliana x Arabidopsis arenosa]|uniref:MATH/TRAF domain n=1 Tax=Arabidopsis thaliana x Arabidopsis arenosa TaxID=1240361 RepID=A0A8T2AXG2_9BRAS|nr:MATH/TRAF domain [Arabidopsis thaliana x Arabidopsis arenosa]